MMLVLSRKEGQWIAVGAARIFILRAAHGRVSVGVEAPPEAKILRGELVATDHPRDDSDREAA